MIQLRCRRARATVDPASGGRLVSLVIDGHEVMGSVSSNTVSELANAEAGHDWFRGSFPLAPWAGELRDGTFLFDGTRHHVALDASGGAWHGVVAERAWHVDHTQVGEETGGAVTLSVPFGPELPGQWPFDGRAVQSFVLDETALVMRLEVHSSRERMPAIAGFHPWFRSALDNGASAAVTFSPRLRLVDRSGDVVAADDLGQRPWDDAFTKLTEPPRISWAGGPTLQLDSDSPIWVYYEQLPGAFCLEPWTGPFNSIESEWAKVVTPGRPLVLNFAIRFD